MKKKKIIIFCDYFGNGGTEKVVSYISKNLNQQLYDVSILTTIYNTKIYDDKVIYISNRKYKSPIYRFFKTTFYIKKFASGVDIIHINVHSSIELFYAYLLRKSVPKIILHAHNSNFDNNILKIKTLISIVFKKIFASSKYKYVACSKQAGDFCFGKNIKYKIIPDEIQTASNLYDKNIREKKRKEYNIPKDCIVIGNIGRFQVQKNHKFLIKIFKEFNSRIPNSMLFLIGEGIKEKEIREQLIKNDLTDSAVIINNINSVEEIYQLFDFYVSTSKYEGYGLTIKEALTSSLKCFVSENIKENFGEDKNICYIKLKEKPKFWADKIAKNLGYARVRKKVCNNYIEKIEQLYNKVDNENKVSIILPIYNEEKLIQKCIQSILNQTYKNWELIIINDGSTDNTLNLIKQYKDNRIKVYSQENKGTGSARNLGLKVASGDYICFIDGDDFIKRDYLKIMINLCKKNNADIVACTYKRKYQIKNYKVLNKIRGLQYLIALPEKIPMSVVGKVFKKNIVFGAKFDEQNYFEDIEFATQAFLKANTIIYYYKNIYKITYHKNSRSKFYKNDDRIQACLDSTSIVNNKYPELFGNYIVYTLYNAIAIANMMIINNDYNEELLKQTQKIVKKYIKYVKKSQYSIIKKMQIYVFNYSFSVYKKIYKILKRGVRNG